MGSFLTVGGVIVLAGNYKCRGIQLISQINPDRADWRGITKPESNRVRKIVQFVGAIGNATRGVEGPSWLARIGRQKDRFRRRPSESDAACAAVHVAAVIEKRSAQFCPDEGKLQREANLLIEHENCLASNRETRKRITWTGLIQGKASQRGAAPANNRSGSGITWGSGSCVGAGKVSETVLANGCRMPRRRDRAKFQFREIGV